MGHRQQDDHPACPGRSRRICPGALGLLLLEKVRERELLSLFCDLGEELSPKMASRCGRVREGAVLDRREALRPTNLSGRIRRQASSTMAFTSSTAHTPSSAVRSQALRLRLARPGAEKPPRLRPPAGPGEAPWVRSPRQALRLRVRSNPFG